MVTSHLTHRGRPPSDTLRETIRIRIVQPPHAIWLIERRGGSASFQWSRRMIVGANMSTEDHRVIRDR